MVLVNKLSCRKTTLVVVDLNVICPMVGPITIVTVWTTVGHVVSTSLWILSTRWALDLHTWTIKKEGLIVKHLKSHQMGYISIYAQIKSIKKPLKIKRLRQRLKKWWETRQWRFCALYIVDTVTRKSLCNNYTSFI